MHAPSHRIPVFLLLALVVSACAPTVSTAVPPTAAPPVEPPASPVPASPGPEAPTPLTVDWVDDDVVVSVDPGWTIAGCAGDAPVLCVAEDGVDVGTVGLSEHGAWHGGSDDELAAALLAEATSFLASLRDDRAAGCPGQTFVAGRVEAVPAPDGALAVRIGFATTRDDLELERVVTYLVLHDGTLWSINASALDPSNDCFAAEGPTFLPATLERFAPNLDALVAGTPVPASPTSTTGA